MRFGHTCDLLILITLVCICIKAFYKKNKNELCFGPKTVATLGNQSPGRSPGESIKDKIALVTVQTTGSPFLHGARSDPAPSDTRIRKEINGTWGWEPQGIYLQQEVREAF